MNRESVKTVFSKDQSSKYEVYYCSDKQIYQVIVYRKLYEETTDREDWERINSTVIYTDSLENAIEIGNEEIKSTGGYLT